MKIIFTVSIIVSTITLLVNQKVTVDAIASALNICTKAIIPSLLPFSILSDILINLNLFQKRGGFTQRATEKLFHLPQEVVPVLLTGTISGFPVSARVVVRLFLDNKITKMTAEHLLLFTSNAGPAFIFGILGGSVFKSTRIAFLLWAIHISTSVLMGLLFRPKSTELRGQEIIHTIERTSYSKIIVDAITGSSLAVANVCVYILTFSVLIAHINNAVPEAWSLHPVWNLLLGTLEISTGLLHPWSLPRKQLFLLSSVMLAWSGFCVHSQILSVTACSGLSTKKYFLGKIIHISLSLIVAFILLPLV